MAVRLPLGWGTVGGSGGIIPGLMAVRLPLGWGTVGGSGGIIPGLMAVRLPLGWGTVGGSGGMIPGLMAVRLPLELVSIIGSERDAAWLETERPKVTARIATDALRRTLNSFEVIRVHLLTVDRGTKRVPQTGGSFYNKSNIEVNLFLA
jgi:hypothetical protein